MKLSDAIILGSVTGPQIFGRLNDIDGSNCGLGAALGAIGQATNTKATDFPWAWTLEGVYHCPECNTYVGTPYVLIAHLNDKHRLLRSQIAQWVSTVEPLYDTLSNHRENMFEEENVLV